MTRVEPAAVARVPRAITGRTIVFGVMAIVATWAFVHVGGTTDGLAPTRGGLSVAASFLSRAASPALAYESNVPSGTTPLLLKALRAAGTTLTFAAASMSLALAAAIVLTFLASSAWWAGDAAGGARRLASAPRAAGPIVYGLARVVIGLTRSIHELLWAVLLLAAFGLGHLTAVLAIAIPYSGVLAKVFSEMIDETPRDASDAMRQAGASSLQVFFVALVPRAMPDMIAYAFYRFECALRSSAILGFFGFPTLGYFIAASFENLLYGEVWTYLYMLFLLVATADWWSGALRRRFVA
jgi:phosphonate transport system permease protein